MIVSAYLQRIGYAGPLKRDLATLTGLHRAHMQSVPFENLDVLLGRPILLNLDRLFDKIVLRRRGGFCYELNGLFGALLEQLGFGVTYLSAGVAHKTGGFGPEYDHMTLLVRPSGSPHGSLQGSLKGLYLADVGFGDSFIEPLPFVSLVEQAQADRRYRIEPVDKSYVLWQREMGKDWERQYRFSLMPHILADYAGMCAYHQTSPQSTFTQKRLCTLATPRGRITLADSRWIVTENGYRTEETLADETAVRQVLWYRFGVDLDRV